jgi:4-hydroxy-tetrahydrodipicolinate reductase
MIKVIVCGGCGKMGSEVAKLIYQNKEMKLIGIIESPHHPDIGKDWGIVVGVGKTGIIIEDNLKKIIQECTQVVEFTNVKASLQHLETVSQHKKTMIMGTTGFTSEEMKKITELALNIPFFLSPMMPLGLMLLFNLVNKAANVLDSNYDIEIIEANHRFKKDSPGRAAKKLAREIAIVRNVNSDDVTIYGRKGLVGERKRDEICIHSVRGGNIIGEHTVIFATLGERLELTHKAHGWDTNARDTIQAIKFMENKPVGFYEMKDVWKL